MLRRLCAGIKGPSSYMDLFKGPLVLASARSAAATVFGVPVGRVTCPFEGAASIFFVVVFFGGWGGVVGVVVVSATRLVFASRQRVWGQVYCTVLCSPSFKFDSSISSPYYSVNTPSPSPPPHTLVFPAVDPNHPLSLTPTLPSPHPQASAIGHDG